MTVHPAALVLAEHYIARLNPVRTPTAPIGCACGWTGPTCDHPAHLAEVLDRAGLLAAGTPPGDTDHASPRREGRGRPFG